MEEKRKINEVIPCICSKEKPTTENGVNYGMPIFMPHNVERKNKKQLFWSYECPVCGRGGIRLTEEKSIHYALKKWNEMQESLYHITEEVENKCQ